MIEDTISLITHVGDTSQLTLDPDLYSYYLMNIVIFQGPELSEALAQARGLGGSIAASGKATPAQLAKLNDLSVLMKLPAENGLMRLSRSCCSSNTSKPTSTPKHAAITARFGDASDQVTSLVASRGLKVDTSRVFRGADQERRVDVFHRRT